jgi:hypothetical protein
MTLRQLTPTGVCWCGCGTQVGPESFFAPGHDKWAEGYVTKTHYGSVAGYLDSHSYGPHGRNARKEASGEQSKFFIRLTIDRGDHVDPEQVGRAIEAQGGIRTRNGFGFLTVEARDAAFQVVAKVFPRYIAAGEVVGTVKSFACR